MKVRKLIALTLCMAAVGSMALTGCGSSSSGSEDTADAGSATSESGSSSTSDFDSSSDISVLSREDGSGTRGAFIELFGVEVKNDDGEKEDMTTVDATITNNTEVMMSTVAGNAYAIGYCSLGTLNDTVKALQIDGVDATVENVSSGDYQVSRPFNILTQDELSDVAQDFMDFIMSDDGQAIVTEEGYIAIESTGAFTSSGATGKVAVEGSSSVSPLMEKLKEAYEEVNSGATIEINTTDSTTGITKAIDGSCDIGMASRDLKDEETGVTATEIARDGIAVIVNTANPIDSLTTEQVRQIFTGEVTAWSDVE